MTANKGGKSPAKEASKQKSNSGVGQTRPAKKHKQVNARFVEDDDKVEFEIEAPADGFASEDQMSTSGSESEEEGKVQFADPLSQSSADS